MKKILIALDFHPSATKIIEAGLLLAKTMEAKVTLLYVKIKLINYSLIYKKVGSLKLDSIADLKLAAQSFLEKSKHQMDNNMIESIVKEGDFAEFVINTAMSVDMIVMGSHNAKWVEEMVMGRISNETLQQTSIPILIIPTRKNDKRNTLISLDL
jgi:nucleotide-binding universal stress UspA family protein